MDTYLFDNFVTANGDTLSAKFKAFKFPDTSYVQFKGTVTVCLDKCQGVSEKGRGKLKKDLSQILMALENVWDFG